MKTGIQKIEMLLSKCTMYLSIFTESRKKIGSDQINPNVVFSKL